MPAFARSCTTSGWGWRFSRGRSPVLPDRDRDDIAGEVTKPPRSSINWGPPPDYRALAGLLAAALALMFSMPVGAQTSPGKPAAHSAAAPRPLHIELDAIPALSFPPTTSYC